MRGGDASEKWQHFKLRVIIIPLYLFIENPIHRIRLVIAGGDGSLIGAVTGAKDAGVDTRNLPVCVLPYGTGNDLARVTNWGG